MDKITERQLKEWLGEDNVIGRDIWERKYRHGDETLDEWFDRVSGGDTRLRNLISQRKFLFGGRTLANRGVEGSGNYFNCFSLGFIDDDYVAIMDALKEVGITFKTQGGQGVSMSKLRPKGAPIGEHYCSDGIMPFIEMLNCVTQGTSQGGSRKGALMISLDATHKEVMDFINIKTDVNAITKANLSLEIDDKFMEAVKQYYIDGSKVVLHIRHTYSGHKVEYDITPIDVYKRMMEVVWDYGEPGCIFTEKFRNYNFLEYDIRYQIETSNPCGEQPLGKQFCCCLGSLNLYEFVKNPFTDNACFDYDDFAEAVHVASNALDAIIDENAERLPEEMHQYKDNSLNWRNIGLGVFGYADMLMALGLEYGTEDAIHYTDSLFNCMMKCAMESNMQRGTDEGAYPKCDPHFIKMSAIYKNHCDNDNNYTRFRNCSLLSIAPTGSIATMMGLSGGIEPEFALSYTRRTDNLEDEYKIEAKVVKDYRRITGDESDELPNYFVTSADIGWHSRIDTQAAIQYHIDTAISSTVNLPQETTKEEIEQLYLYAWERGLKGITIFRDGCKRFGILITDKDEHEDDINRSQFKRGDIINVSNDLIGYKRKVINGCGDFQEQIFFDETTGEPMENYIAMGDGGGCSRNLEAISRLISLCLRGGIDVSEIIKQLKKVRTCSAYRIRSITRRDTSRGSSCPSAIGFAIEELCDKIKDRCFADYDFEEDYIDTDTGFFDDFNTESNAKSYCPDCGEPVTYEGGCVVCHSCGWSKCG